MAELKMVYEKDAPRCDPAIFDLGIPILGICYGMQLACQILGGEVRPGVTREFGRAKLEIIHDDVLVRRDQGRPHAGVACLVARTRRDLGRQLGSEEVVADRAGLAGARGIVGV